MEWPVSRRVLLRLGGAGLAGGVAGCNRIADVFPPSPSADSRSQSPARTVTGQVVTGDGSGLAGVTVDAVAHDRTRLARTTTDGDGQFRLETDRPVWMRVTAEGYHDRVVTGRPGVDQRIGLTPDDETATLCFGGDVMFGRRFYEPPSDRRIPRFRIQYGNLREDHRRILDPVAPLLGAADVTSVNLETPLTTSDWRHPTKLFTYTSHPVAAGALADAGVDYVALGNNHAFDALRPGLLDTENELQSAGIAFSGAGRDSEGAWEPAVLEASGLEVAMLSCTTIVGGGQELDWSADRGTGGTHTVQQDGETLAFSEELGVAEATEQRLVDRVTEATERADVVVVQIHGGEPYRRTPTEEVRRLTETAAAAGADLVVNHHPHVVGGLERIGSTVVAWSLGNLVFDQQLWVTFPTYLLTAYVTVDDVVRVTVDPLLIDGFVPKGVVGKPNRWTTWVAAANSEDEFGITRNGLEFRKGSERTGESRELTRTLPGDGTIYARDRGWVSELDPGAADLGRDLLPTGTFESIDIDDTGHDGTLWLFDRERGGSRRGFGYGGGGGFRLQRVDRNSVPLILLNSRRIPVSGPLTATGLYRTSTSEGVELLVNWYPDTSGGAIRTDSWDLDSTRGNWERVTRELAPPEDTTHANLLFRLSPPGSGTRTVDVDDLRLIEWADPGVIGGRGYDHLRVDRETTVRFGGAPDQPGESPWHRLPEQ